MGAKLSVQKDEIPEERTFIVTGANTGIGYHTSKKIAQLGGRVIMACRSEEKAKKAIDQMQEENRQEVRAKRKAAKDAAERERQQKEAAAAKEEQEKKKEEARKQKEEAKQAALAKTEEAAAKAAAEEKKEDGAEKAEETGDKPEEEKPKEDGEKPAEEEEKPAAAEETEKPAEEEEKKADEGEDKPAEEKEEEKPAEGGEKEEPAAASAAAAEGGAKEDGDAPAEAEPEPEEEIPELKLQFMPLDLASFESVLEFVKQYKESGLPLNVLICNGGLIAPAKVLTNDGLESTFQINYLSHFLLTLHLLPVLKASAPNSKIINVSSSGHKRGDGVNLDNIQSQKSYSQGKAYGNSKLFQIMNTFSLHSKIKDTGIDVFSVHPGVVDTGFSKGYSGLYKAATLLHKGFGRTSDDGAATTLSAALDEQFHGKGPLYFSSCKPVQPSATARNEEQQKQLWIYSLGLLQEHLDDTLLADVGETLESIKPKEPEPEPEPKTAEEEGDKKEEEGAKEEEKGADGDKTDEKKEDGDKPEEKKDEEAGGGDAKPSQETEEKAAEEEKPSEEQKEDEAEEEKKEE